MDTQEFIKQTNEISLKLSKETDFFKVQFYINELYRKNREFVNKFNGYNIIKKCLTWDAEIELISWVEDKEIYEDVEGISFYAMEFKIDGTLINLETCIDTKTRLPIDINLCVNNELIYKENDGYHSNFGKEIIEKIIDKSNIERRCDLVGFLVNLQACLENC